MSRRRRIPERGDVPASLVAELLGLSLAEFEVRQLGLRERGLPEPDPPTGLYCIGGGDRWGSCLDRDLFPELPSTRTAPLTEAVFGDGFDRLSIVDGPRPDGIAADRASCCDFGGSLARDLGVDAKAKPEGFWERYSCPGRPEVQTITANALSLVRTSWPSEIATRASG